MSYECAECQSVLEQVTEYNDEEWYIDDGVSMNSRDNKRLFHLCRACRLKNGNGYPVGDDQCSMCDRCWKYSKCGKGKWNTNKGHVHCCTCGNLCYTCHGLIHYNK